MRYDQPDPRLTNLDRRVLSATRPRGRDAPMIADGGGCLPDVKLSALRRLRDRGLVETMDTAHRASGSEPTAATPPWSSSHPPQNEAYGQAARERGLLRASVELAIPRLVTARQLLAATSNAWEADDLLRHAIHELTVGVD